MRQILLPIIIRRGADVMNAQPICEYLSIRGEAQKKPRVKKSARRKPHSARRVLASAQNIDVSSENTVVST
jgi:hypothetical protein